MALPANTRLAIAQEGLEDLDDLVKFDEKSLKHITKTSVAPEDVYQILTLMLL